MSLTAFSLKETPSIAVTGTDDITVVSQGNTLGEAALIWSSDTDGKTRRNATLKVNPPKPSATAPNGYTQARSGLFLRTPFLLDNGGLTTNTGAVNIGVDIESTQAEIEALLDDLIQLLKHADVRPFWTRQALS